MSEITVVSKQWQIVDLDLTLKIIPKMTRYDAFGKPDKDGEYCVVHGEWLEMTLTELKERRDVGEQ